MTEREAQWRIYEAAQLRIASSLDIAMLRHAWLAGWAAREAEPAPMGNSVAVA